MKPGKVLCCRFLVENLGADHAQNLAKYNRRLHVFIMASLSMSFRSLVHSAPAHCLGGLGSNFHRGLRFFLCPTLMSCSLLHLYHQA